MHSSESFWITRNADTIVAKRRVRELASVAGFGFIAVSELAIVTKELASNLVKYAGKGRIDCNIIDNDEAKGIEIVSFDNGPGIRSVNEALRKGFSTSGSLGYGLSIINELMDDLDIQSHHNSVNETIIKTRRWLPKSVQPDISSHFYRFDVSVATRPHPKMMLNGDAHVVLRWPGHLLVSVIDGLGHGQHAHKASLSAKHYIEAHKEQPISSILKGANRACRGTRGAVIAMLHFETSKQSVSHACIGNIECHCLGRGPKRSFVVRRGVVGINMPAKVVVTDHPFYQGDIFTLYSDGINNHSSLNNVPAALLTSATKTALYILEHYSRDCDDATIAIICVEKK